MASVYRQWALGGLAIIGFASSVGCGLNAQGNYQKMRPALARRDYAAADAYVAAAKDKFYGSHNALLYAMDRSMVLHLGGAYARSNACLEEAKTTAQALWTQSVSQNAAAWLTTDEAMPYQGEDFEKVMLHVVGALNYLSLGALDEARVETRQVSERLALYAEHEAEAGDRAYRDDAFARWLSGILYEADATEPGALGDAWIDYRRALALYEQAYGPHYGTPVPTPLVADALRVLEALGGEYRSTLEELRRRYPSVPHVSRRQAAQQGRVVLVHATGEAPFKVDQFWTVPLGFNVLRIAYPAFVPKRHAIVQARLTVRPATDAAAAPVVAETALAEDITNIAMRDLADHMGRIKTRAIARATAKFTAGSALQVVGATRGDGKGALMEVAGLAFNTTNALMEHADKRSWLTLPAQYAVAEAFVPPGTLACTVEFLDVYGRVVEQATLSPHVAPGGTLFLSTRTLL
jgi:hypothetical protein